MQTSDSKPAESIGTIGFALGPTTKSQELWQKKVQNQSLRKKAKITVEFLPKTMISTLKGPKVRYKSKIWAKSVEPFSRESVFTEVCSLQGYYITRQDCPQSRILSPQFSPRAPALRFVPRVVGSLTPVSPVVRAHKLSRLAPGEEQHLHFFYNTFSFILLFILNTFVFSLQLVLFFSFFIYFSLFMYYYLLFKYYLLFHSLFFSLLTIFILLDIFFHIEI